MYKPNFIFKVVAFSFICLLNFTAAFAQSDAKPQTESSYEVVLQVLVGSNAAAPNSILPANLFPVTKNLKNSFSLSNFNLISTNLQRLANAGSLELKSVSAGRQGNAVNSAPTFSEWTIGQLKSLPNAGQQDSVQISNFRFGQRIPIVVANSAVNYEQVGLSLQKLNLPENLPTVVGSLSTPNPNEMMFLILTVKQADK